MDKIRIAYLIQKVAFAIYSLMIIIFGVFYVPFYEKQAYSDIILENFYEPIWFNDPLCYIDKTRFLITIGIITFIFLGIMFFTYQDIRYIKSRDTDTFR